MPASGRRPAHLRRCPWAAPDDPLYLAYHDAEWGVPVHDDRRLFEFLVLEGAQAGLSWSTILHKREHYRRAFRGFDPQQVARFTARDVQRLLADPGIVRNRLKVESAVGNARAFLAVQRDFGSFDSYVWSFVGGKPRVNRRRALRSVPARSAESDALSADLKKRGFRFVGGTICYAFMQAVGMVDDHLVTCFRRDREHGSSKVRPERRRRRPTVRAYRPEDLPAVIALFGRSVRELAARDYSPAQVAAWAPAAPDTDAWAKRLAAGGVFVGCYGARMAGFGTIDANGYLDLLYVDPVCQHRGVARALFERMASWAATRDLRRLYADVSLTARPFFARMGFRVVRVQAVRRRGVSFRNFRMEWKRARRPSAPRQRAATDA